MTRADMVERMTKLSKATQEKYFMQGLALGLLALGVESIPKDKPKFEFALSHAARRSRVLDNFPSVLSVSNMDAYHQLGKSRGRRGPHLGVWEETQAGWSPAIGQVGWTIEESGQMLAEWSGISWPQWMEFARLMRDHIAGQEA